MYYMYKYEKNLQLKMVKKYKLFPLECVFFFLFSVGNPFVLNILNTSVHCVNLITLFLDIFCRLLPQRSGRGMMGRRLRWTHLTRSEPRSCVTSTTVSTWSTWPRMRDSMSCWHSNTQWRYETAAMSLISTQNIFHQVFSFFAQKYFNYTCLSSSILGEKQYHFKELLNSHLQFY